MMIIVFACLLAINTASGARLMNCMQDQIKFEKIIGLRPSDYNHPLLLHKSEKLEPVTTECLSKCFSNDECVSFVLYYNISECYWYKNPVESIWEHQNVIDTNCAWFSKTCLNVTSCQKSWIFERIPGAILIGNNTKSLPNKTTRSQCQQYCLDEKTFQCRSAKFRIVDDNFPNSTETVGSCILSNADRHLMPNSYRVSSYDEEYFENQCSTATTEDFCAYEEYENTVIAHTDAVYRNKTKEDCEKLCIKTTVFNCGGYSLLPMEDSISENQTCLITSEDSKIHGSKLLLDFTGAKYYEKARCINVSVTCTATYITVRYQPEIIFKGKIYMKGYYEHLECYAMGQGMATVTLKIPLFGNQCGITEAKSHNYFNRTLLSGTMILQYNSLIQTHGDRLIKVGCIFDNDTKVVVGTGVNFTASLPNIGNTVISNSTILPTVAMRVVDLREQTEVSDTLIGQELQLVIEIKPPNGPYDIWAGHLVAMTEKAQDSILLLDDRGCPTNLNIFPALSKVHNNSTRKLVATFQAFKFSSSSVVRFTVIVQFCTMECKPVDCANNLISYGRKKRDTFSSSNGTNVIKINREEFDGVQELPLEFVLYVRNSKISPDRLIVGENNKILVAGYDYITNEVCIDYSLLIGLIITWVLIQVILVTSSALLIRRYKRYYEYGSTRQSLEELNKNFGFGFSNLDNRRVRWADSPDLT